jgi:hypothetical protein
MPSHGLPPAAGPVTSRQSSKLFSGLFRSTGSGERLIVLEIGPALPETVDFFSRFKCRLYFKDLFSEPFLREEQDKLSEKELRQRFEKHFDFPQGAQLDVILLWDFLSFLNDSALRAFNSAIRPWIHSGTRAHGFGVHHMAIKLENIQYGVIDTENLSVRQRRGRQMSYHPHSQIEMHEMLSCFDFERGLLLPNGKLEMLLKPRVAAGA